MVELTEFEKAILITFLLLTRGSTRKEIEMGEIVRRVPMRRRAACRRWIVRLAKKGFLLKKDERYCLSKQGLNEARKLLITGAKLLTQ